MKIEDLIAFNNWWIDKTVKPSLLQPYKRRLFYELLKFLEDRQILMIVGLRRVGKTTLLYQLIQYLLEKNVDNGKILYFSFDERVESLKEVLGIYQKEILNKSFDEVDRAYIILDEVHKLKNWQEQLKLFYDLYSNIKFIISGSASLNLERRARESLAGRTYHFRLDLLSFEEFLEMKLDLKPPKNLEELKLWKTRLESYFSDYLKRAFPEIIDEEEEKVKKYVQESVVERIIYRDLPSEFGLRDVELLRSLIFMVAENPGMILNIEQISRDLKRNKRTISNYFYYLEYALLFRIVKNFRRSFLAASRKMKKVYLSHPSLVFGISKHYYGLLPKVMECFILNFLNAEYYWREKNKEVDFIIERNGALIPVEVKHKAEITKSDLRGLLKFMEKFKIHEGIVITKDLLEEREIKGKIIRFIPTCLFWRLL